MQNNFYDAADPLHPYTYSIDATTGTMPPRNALRGDAPAIKVGYWPGEKSGEWVDIEDHRVRLGEYAQPGTPYWLPSEGDVHGSPARLMQTVGPLPDGAVTTEPAATTDELFAALRGARDAKLRDEYDPHIAQLIRQQRRASTDEERAAIATQIAAWDAYAVALCDLPEQDGTPWTDGDIPWPTPPKATKAALATNSGEPACA